MKQKQRKIATVHVELTEYGKASYLAAHAAESADFCEHPTSDATARFNRHARCNALAKFTLEGMRVCGKHASVILLREAYRAAVNK